MLNIVDRIRVLRPGTVIPKPAATADFTVHGWGVRRGEPALIYNIPNHRDRARPHRKGVTESEFERAHEQLLRTGEITRVWFNTAMAACAAEGGCNFTTIGGVFELLGLARYEGAAYRLRA